MSSDATTPTIFFQTCLGVFQGGGCRAAAFAGAFEEATARGVHFAEVAGTSAGAITAALIGAGATPAQLNECIARLNFNRFLVSPEEPAVPGSPFLLKLLKFTRYKSFRPFFSHLGLHSSSEIEKWMDQELAALLPHVKGPIRFEHLHIPTWVVATDLRTSGVQIWSTKETPKQEVAKAVRASCSIPVFFQPVERRYVDGGALSNLPSFVFLSPDNRPLSSRILAFTLRAEDEELDGSSASGLVKSMLNTAIEGSQDLQLRMQRDVHIISIPTGNVKATDFDKMNDDTIRWLIEAGVDETRRFFDDEVERVKAKPLIAMLCYDEEEMYAAIVENLERHITDIIIADEKTNWAYSLYPSLLYWRTKKVRIRALLRKGNLGKHEAYRRRLLGALGVEIFEVEQIPIIGYLFNPENEDHASAVIRIPSGVENKTPIAVRYGGNHDYVAITAMRNQIESLCVPTAKGDYYLSTSPPRLAEYDEASIRTLLRKVVEYTTPAIDLEVRRIRTDSLISLTRNVREYKYRQIQNLAGLYKEFGLDWFRQASVDYGDGRSTVVTPPVIEERGGKNILIQGTTRAVFCRNKKEEYLTCVVVRGVNTLMPTDQRVELSRVQIAGREISRMERYGVDNLVIRRIEEMVHPTDGLK